SLPQTGNGSAAAETSPAAQIPQEKPVTGAVPPASPSAAELAAPAAAPVQALAAAAPAGPVNQEARGRVEIRRVQGAQQAPQPQPEQAPGNALPAAAPAPARPATATALAQPSAPGTAVSVGALASGVKTAPAAEKARDFEPETLATAPVQSAQPEVRDPQPE